MENATRFGITRFLLLRGTPRRGDSRCLASALIPQVDINVIVEPEPLGTAGALRFAAKRLEPTFLMANGDSFFDINLLDVALPPRPADWLGKLALRRLPNTERYGVVNVDAGRIVAFEPRGSGGEGVINGGVYLLRRDIVERIGPGLQIARTGRIPARRGRRAAPRYDLRWRLHRYRRTGGAGRGATRHPADAPAADGLSRPRRRAQRRSWLHS